MEHLDIKASELWLYFSFTTSWEIWLLWYQIFYVQIYFLGAFHIYVSTTHKEEEELCNFSVRLFSSAMLTMPYA